MSFYIKADASKPTETFLSLDVAKMTFKSQIFPLVAANMGDLGN